MSLTNPSQRYGWMAQLALGMMPFLINSCATPEQPEQDEIEIPESVIGSLDQGESIEGQESTASNVRTQSGGNTLASNQSELINNVETGSENASLFVDQPNSKVPFSNGEPLEGALANPSANAVPVTANLTGSNLPIGTNLPKSTAVVEPASTSETPPARTNSPAGELVWVSYDYQRQNKQVVLNLVAEGGAKFEILTEKNRAGQTEYVVRYFNSVLRRSIRRDLDATEFRSPVAYVRMRTNESKRYVDVVVTTRESVEPTIDSKSGSLTLSFKIGDHWFAPTAEARPVASAEFIDGSEAPPNAANRPNEESKSRFLKKANHDGSDATLHAKYPEQSRNVELLNRFKETRIGIKNVAQGNFTDDIPQPAGSNPASELLEDLTQTPSNASNSALLDSLTPVVSQGGAPVAKNPQQDLEGVSVGSASKTSTKKAVRLDFRDAPISQIIRTIASESGMNFIVSPDAGKQKTSISLRNVPWDVALKAILDANRLGAQEIAPNLIRIDFLKVFAEDNNAEERARQSTEALVQTKVLVMPLNYAKADDAAKLVQSMLPKPSDQSDLVQKRNYDRFKVQADTRSNSVVIEATPTILTMIKTLLDRLDVQTPQVKISSRVVEISNDIADGLGLSWNSPFSIDPGRGLGFGSLPFPNYISSQFAVDPGGVAEKGASAAIRLGSLNNVLALDLKLRMYETKRQAETLQTQDVVVQDNEKAVIGGGSIDYFLIPGSATSAPSLSDVKYDLSLMVQPHITADGGVQMKIEIKGDSPKDPASAQGLAAKNTRQLATTLLKRSGETAVIGGLYSSEVSKTERAVPLLSKLPLIGALFRNRESKNSKKDLLIMVTPTIIASSASVNGDSSGADMMPPLMNAAPASVQQNIPINNSNTSLNQATSQSNVIQNQSGNVNQSNNVE